MLYLLYKCGQGLVLRFPLEISYKIAERIADVYCFFAFRDRRNIVDNLTIALGKSDRKLIKKLTRNIFRNFAKYLVDFFRFPAIDDEYIKNNIAIVGRENLDIALKKGKGVIVLTAHIGNWELGAAVTARLGHPFQAIVLDHKNKRVNDFFSKQRFLHNVNSISLGSQLKNCFRVLQKNELLAIAGDRDFSNTGIKADFFGRPAILPKGAAAFSLKTGAPIVPAFLTRREYYSYTLTFEKPVETKITGNKEMDTINLMREYFSVIEKYVREFPDQWYAFRKIWD